MIAGAIVVLVDVVVTVLVVPRHELQVTGQSSLASDEVLQYDAKPLQ
jgi:hypothetical protein